MWRTQRTLLQLPTLYSSRRAVKRSVLSKPLNMVVAIVRGAKRIADLAWVRRSHGRANVPANVVWLSTDFAEAIRAGTQKQFGLVLTDLKLPDGDGLTILRRWRESGSVTPFIVITGFGTVSSAVEAMKLGASDYIGKPLSSPDELRILTRKALASRQLENEREALREEVAARFSTGSVVASHPSMVKIFGLMRKVAPTNAMVLITGESGTGKEILARLIHDNSSRRERVFVAVNCAALSPTLIESELFGHEKGAFTGAAAQHAGRFERAQGGTLFLDEIGELDSGLQMKLLRVLQERTFERVGGARQISADVRVVAASNRDLKRK
jgi:DNA-binding NtrC family response regulator